MNKAAERAADAVRAYRKIRTARKATEAPVVVGIIATGVYLGATAAIRAMELDVEISTEWCMGIALTVYGAYCGLRNWRKNRDR